MHMVMLSDIETYGGAAIAASRLAEGLCRAGHRLTRVVARPDGQVHCWETVPLAFSRYGRAVRYMLPAAVWASASGWVARRRLDYLLDRLRPDVINVHNLHMAAWTGWSPDILRVCARHAPTVWTLHDMWSFTGGCVYAYDCRKFVSGCDATCALTDEGPPTSPRLAARAWRQRQRLFAACPELVAVAPSRWLAKEAGTGLWAGHRVEVIPNGLPLHVYEPVNRSLAREALGIRSPGPVLLVAAADLAEKRKGGTLLIESLRRLSIRPYTLLVLGSGSVELGEEGVTVFHLGYIGHERTKVLVYSAADLLIHPAPVDNLPNVIVEAMACGTPAAGFPIGGVPELIRPGQTGWLAGSLTPASLAEIVQQAWAELDGGLDLRSACRRMVESEYDVELQAGRYLHLFEELTGVAPIDR